MALRVVIVGGGIGGSSAAVLLSRLSEVKVSVYERDASDSVRRYQGYSLSMAANGLKAMKKMGLLEKITEQRSQSSFLHLVDKHNKWDVKMAEESVQIERGRIVDVLHHELSTLGVPVHYGKKCVGCKVEEDSVSVKFEDGEEVGCDILIAADGSRSAIRQQHHFKDDKLLYSGMYSVTYQLPGDHPAILSLSNKSQSIMGRGVRFLSKFNQPKWTVSLSFALPYGDAEKRWASTSDMEKEVKQKYYDQNFYVSDAIKKIDIPPEGTRYIMEREPLKPWKATRVMLIGDACHPMTPFAGQGANMALEDAVELYEAMETVVNKKASIEEALNKFEREMLARTTPVVKQARFLAWAYSRTNPILCWLRDLFFYYMTSYFANKMAHHEKKAH